MYAEGVDALCVCVQCVCVRACVRCAARALIYAVGCRCVYTRTLSFLAVAFPEVTVRAPHDHCPVVCFEA